MFRTLILLSTAMCLAGPATAAPVPVASDDSPLAVVPAQAPIVVHIKGIDRVRGRLKTLMTNIAPDFGPVAAAQIDSALVNLPEDRKLQGLNPNGSLFVAVMELPAGGNEPPAAALIARVSKYSEFRDGLLTEDERKQVKANSAGFEAAEIHGQTIYFIDRRDYAIVTHSKDTAQTLAKNYKGMDGSLTKALASKLLDNDLALYVNLAEVNKQFGDNIRQIRDLFLGMMEQGVGGLDKNTAEMAKKIYGSLFQAVLDGQAVVAGFDFRPDGLAITALARVGAETDSNQFLKDQKPVALEQFGKLPAGQMVYSATSMSPEGMKMLVRMMQGMGVAEGETKKALDKLADAGGRANYVANNYPPAGLTFQEFEHPKNAFAATIEMLKTMNEGSAFSGGMIKGKPEIKENAETHRDIKFTSFRLVWDYDKMAEMIPGGGDAIKNSMKKLLGEEMKGWIGLSGNRVIQVIAKDWSAAKTLLDAFLDGKDTIGAAAPFQATRKSLPAEASVLSFMDAGPFTFMMTDYMLQMLKAMPLPINLPDKLTPVKMDTSFIGAAITLQPERGGFDLYVPIAAAQQIRKIVNQILVGGS